MKRYLYVVLFSLISALSFGTVLPVTIDSASINYKTNTITVTGQGFCADSKLPIVVFNLTQLKLVTTVCSNGVANAGYYVLTTTNLTVPASAWTFLSTNVFDNNGAFSITNAVNPGTAQRFYLIKLQ